MYKSTEESSDSFYRAANRIDAAQAQSTHHAHDAAVPIQSGFTCVWASPARLRPRIITFQCRAQSDLRWAECARATRYVRANSCRPVAMTDPFIYTLCNCAQWPVESGYKISAESWFYGCDMLRLVSLQSLQMKCFDIHWFTSIRYRDWCAPKWHFRRVETDPLEIWKSLQSYGDEFGKVLLICTAIGNCFSSQRWVTRNISSCSSADSPQREIDVLLNPSIGLA